MFAPARDDAQVAALRARHLSARGFAEAAAATSDWLSTPRISGASIRPAIRLTIDI